MSVSNMAKIRLTVVKDAYDGVIDVLHNLGTVEIEQADAPEKDLYQPESKAEYWQTNAKFALDLLSEYKEEEKKSFADKLASTKRRVRKDELEDILNGFDYKSLIAELENLDKKFNLYRNKISQHKKEINTLKEWQGLPAIKEKQTRFSKILIGTVPAARYENFVQAINEEKLAESIKISESEREVRISMVFANQIEDKINSILEQFEFKAVDLGLDAKTIDSRIKELNKEIEENQRTLELTKERIKQYAIHIPKFQILYDYLSWKREQDEASKKAMATKETVSIIGWVPSSILTELTKNIDKVTNIYLLEELEIDPEDKIPVVLKNATAITPFESVTEIYGAPLQDEPDPTVYLAPFFMIYFAFCLSDAAYGLLLALLAYAALKLMNPSGMSRKLMKLMIMCGIATFFVGAIFGGWFGITISELPPGPITDFVNSIRLLDPVQDPMTVMLIAFILGFIQLVVGNLVDLFWKLKHGQVVDGLLGGGIWALFLLIIGFWIAVKAGAVSGDLQNIANYSVIGGVAAMVLTQGREKKNIFAKLASGVASLYGLVGYLSDILSYSRLLALGLSTGIIAMVVNLVAGLFAGMIPYVGWLVWIVVIVAGHLFNLVISVLGAFIHSGRLQYVEFFPKFLVGGGRKFKPFIKTSKYITLTNQ